MSDDQLAAAVVCYLAGCTLTLLAIDMPARQRFLFLRCALWPLYWAYLLIKMGFMLEYEWRR
ncbi:hypothetical protein [Pseudomonas iridis]|uniref:hypothetical protein n=1 Tax=Pseudomonas iridis TaxID=2710587 RepID=UPI001B33D120|nr:hypothetical protein [Pseudomonas iridis]MBP5971048.1 hypothetical protein [Pseudomonas iridis]